MSALIQLALSLALLACVLTLTIAHALRGDLTSPLAWGVASLMSLLSFWLVRLTWQEYRQERRDRL